MAPIDAAHAPERLLSISVDGYRPGFNRPGMCLRWSYFAYGLTPNQTPANIAMDAWNYAPAEHRHPITATTVVPAGLPIILGPSPSRTDANRNAGDVFPAFGQGKGLDGLGPMTDSPRLGAGRIGVASLGERARQSARPVYGYLTRWLGYDLAGGPAGSTITPAPSEDPMTDYSLVRQKNDKKVYLSVDRMTRRWIHDATELADVLWVLNGAGGNAAAAAKRPIDVVDRIAAYGVDITGLDGLSAAQSVGLSSKQVTDLASAVAPKVASALSATIAPAVADLLAARLKD